MKSEVEHTLLPHALPQDLRGPLPFQTLDITMLLFHYFFLPIPKLKRGHKWRRRQFKREKYMECIEMQSSQWLISTGSHPWVFFGWGYRLQMLTHLSLSHPLTFPLTHSPPFIFTQHRYKSSQRAQVYFLLHGGCKHWKHKLCLKEEVGETTEDALCRRHNGERITMASCRASGTQRGITANGT